MLDEGLDRDPHPRRDGTAEELTVLRDRGEDRRGAERHDDRGPAVAGVRRDGVGDPVGAHFTGVVVQDPHPGADAGTDLERRLSQVVAAQPPQRLGELGHDARDRDRGDVREPIAAELEKLPPEHRVLVGAAAAVGRHRPVREAGLRAVQCELDQRVSDVNGEEHRWMPPFHCPREYRTVSLDDRTRGGTPERTVRFRTGYRPLVG